MLPVGDLVSVLGLGGTVAAALPLFMVVWYLFRAKKVAGMAASAGATAFVVAASATASVAIVLALGWASPRVSIMLEDLRALAEAGDGPARTLLRMLVDAVATAGVIPA